METSHLVILRAAHAVTAFVTIEDTLVAHNIQSALAIHAHPHADGVRCAACVSSIVKNAVTAYVR